MYNKAGIKISNLLDREDDDNIKLIQPNNLEINQKKEKYKKSQTELKVIMNESLVSLNQNEDQINSKFESFFIYKNKKETINYYILFLIIIFILIIIFYYFRFQEIVKETVKKDFKVLVKKYEYLLDKNDTIPEDSPIWIMWYQGIKNAPALIKSCIQSVIINREKHPVYIVDQNNYKKYVDLPDYILKKFNDGKFSITHFSDIIRMALLAKHGGYWIDSTYFVTTPLIYDNYSLFTLKLSQCYPGTVTKCRWAGNFLGMPKNSFLSVYAYNAFLLYWKNYDKLIDYFLIDEIILVGFDNAPKLRTLIDKLPYITCNIFTFDDILNNELNYSDFGCLFNKFNRRKNRQSSMNITKTNYEYLIETYKLDYNNLSNFGECLK